MLPECDEQIWEIYEFILRFLSQEKGEEVLSAGHD